jgi:hypothetical protein
MSTNNRFPRPWCFRCPLIVREVRGCGMPQRGPPVAKRDDECPANAEPRPHQRQKSVPRTLRFARSLCSAINRAFAVFAPLVERLRARAHRRYGILMMQAFQNRFREHERTRRQSMSGFGFRDRRSSSWRIRYSRAQHAMRSTTVVMFYPRFENRPQMCLRERGHPIQAFSSYGPDHAFAD